MTPASGAVAGVLVAAFAAASLVAWSALLSKRGAVVAVALSTLGFGAVCAVVAARLRGDAATAVHVASAVGVGALWTLALAALGALFRVFASGGAAAVAIALVSGASLTTPWWARVLGSEVPAFAEVMNPWIAAVGLVGGFDWIRAEGVYPYVGAAYTSAASPTESFVAFGATACVAGSIVVAARFFSARRAA
jgi:hypothetical protein